MECPRGVASAFVLCDVIDGGFGDDVVDVIDFDDEHHVVGYRIGQFVGGGIGDVADGVFFISLETQGTFGTFGGSQLWMAC